MSQRLYRCKNCRRTRFHEREVFDIKFSDVSGVSKVHITSHYVCDMCGVTNYLTDIAEAAAKEEEHEQRRQATTG